MARTELAGAATRTGLGWPASAPTGRPARPRLVFDALSLQPEGSGVQRYVRELLSALPGVVDADVVATVTPAGRSHVPGGIDVVVRAGRDSVGRAWSGARRPGGADVVHGLDVHVPWRSTSLSVSTVHDLAVFDVPRSFSRRYAALQRRVMALAMRHADAVIADSGFTADRVRARFGRRAVVVPLAAPGDMAPPTLEAIENVRRRYHLPERFVLHVGRDEPRKDLASLLEAGAAARVPVVVAGPSAPRPRPGALHVGYVPRRHLAALYGAATVVAYPSRYEGYGLPPVEAMACGTPVVAYRIPPLVENLAGVAWLVPPGDVAALAGALSELVADPAHRAQLAAAGRARAAATSWGDVARATADVYRQMGVAC